jgi:pimeloyl-ACP methyl ester carboxylesterase
MARMRRLTLVGLLFLFGGCTTAGSDDGDTATSEGPPTAQPTTSTTAQGTTSTITRTSTDQILEDLDGELCPDSDFTCVTIEMPLDHFEPEDERTIPVTFAVMPASGDMTGVFVTATGGPGTSGIASADSYTEALNPAIPESYDIVFFDQRGVAQSGGLSCPAAAAAYYRIDGTSSVGFDEEALAAGAATFANDCVAEMGDPEMLPYLGTDQVAADLDLFRETFGYDQIVLYGESYGTQVSQTYAAAYADSLSRLILDGTVDLTLEGLAFFQEQALAFGQTLQSTLDYCAADEVCTEDVGTTPDQAYDSLVSLLVEEPLTARFPLPNGEFAERTFSQGDLEVVASGQTYSEDDRMMFLRALAAYSGRGDLVPLLRLLYLNLGLDPSTEIAIEDPTYSDAVYYGVECLDYSYPGSTPEETAQAFFDAGADMDPARLGVIFFGDLPCAYWPNASKGQPRPEPLTAAGIPTVVISSTADPATPYEQGVDVTSRLDDGHLITQQGGPHVVFGRGNECPDDAVSQFILEGTPPAIEECEGDVVGYYIPLLPVSTTEFDSAETMFDAIEFDLFYLPEYYWWDTVTETPVGCNQGGVVTFVAEEGRDGFRFDECAFMEGVTLTGEGSYNWDEDVFRLDVEVGSPECRYVYERAGEEYTVEDNCPTDVFTS